MAGLPGFASHESSLIWDLAANGGSSWMSGALNLHSAMLLLIGLEHAKKKNIYEKGTLLL